MSEETATTKMQRVRYGYRARRAEVLAAMVMCELRDLVPKDCYSKAHRRVYDAFFKADVEIVTAEDRRKAGLPERDEDGLSPQQHQILDASMTLAMCRTVPVFIPADGKKIGG